MTHDAQFQAELRDVAATRRRCGCPSSVPSFLPTLTAPRSELRVWATPRHQERALPSLRALLELPFGARDRLARRAGAHSRRL
jgi:hypothetical protein